MVLGRRRQRRTHDLVLFSLLEREDERLALQKLARRLLLLSLLCTISLILAVIAEVVTASIQV